MKQEAIRFGGTVIDPTPVFCEEKGCHIAIDGTPLYVDADHFTKTAAERLSGLSDSAFPATGFGSSASESSLIRKGIAAGSFAGFAFISRDLYDKLRYPKIAEWRLKFVPSISAAAISASGFSILRFTFAVALGKGQTQAELIVRSGEVRVS
ncbi:MAG: hypothetical protein E6Q98_00315 [Rhodospirillaceae bacterium]|nr:MAG: hypothetical protein E6Q98_00315 [Rhodospirillaceae bacterium]